MCGVRALPLERVQRDKRVKVGDVRVIGGGRGPKTRMHRMRISLHAQEDQKQEIE